MDNSKESRVHQQQISTHSFLTKTYEILENSTYNDIIQWNENGTAFIIKKPQEFAKNVLPKYFKHSDYTSFTKHLEIYNFHKIKNELGIHIFQHKYFQKEQKNLLGEIKRKPQEFQEQFEENQQQTKLSLKLSMTKLKNDYQFFHQEILEIKAQQLQFQQAINQFLIQNDYLVNQNTLLWHEIQKIRDIDDKKIDNFSYLLATLITTINSSEQISLSQFTSYQQSSSSDISISQQSSSANSSDQSISPQVNQNQIKQNKQLQSINLKQPQQQFSSKQDISLLDQGLNKRSQNQIQSFEYEAYQNGIEYYQKLMELSQQQKQKEIEENQHQFFIKQRNDLNNKRSSSI